MAGLHPPKASAAEVEFHEPSRDGLVGVAATLGISDPCMLLKQTVSRRCLAGIQQDWGRKRHTDQHRDITTRRGHVGDGTFGGFRARPGRDDIIRQMFLSDGLTNFSVLTQSDGWPLHSSPT